MEPFQHHYAHNDNTLGLVALVRGTISNWFTIRWNILQALLTSCHINFLKTWCLENGAITNEHESPNEDTDPCHKGEHGRDDTPDPEEWRVKGIEELNCQVRVHTLKQQCQLRIQDRKHVTHVRENQAPQRQLEWEAFARHDFPHCEQGVQKPHRRESPQ